jgi:hypothetical protein
MDRLRGRWPRQVEGVEALESRMVLWGQRQSERLRRRLPRR